MSNYNNKFTTTTITQYIVVSVYYRQQYWGTRGWNFIFKVLHSVLQCYTVAVLYCSSVSLDMATYGVRLLYDMLLVIIATSKVQNI